MDFREFAVRTIRDRPAIFMGAARGCCEGVHLPNMARRPRRPNRQRGHYYVTFKLTRDQESSSVSGVRKSIISFRVAGELA
jgi:hypothetical protein